MRSVKLSLFAMFLLAVVGCGASSGTPTEDVAPAPSASGSSTPPQAVPDAGNSSPSPDAAAETSPDAQGNDDAQGGGQPDSGNVTDDGGQDSSIPLDSGISEDGGQDSSDPIDSAPPPPVDSGTDSGPAPVCTQGAASCAGLIPRSCESGQWVSGSACPFVCANGACVGVCTPNSMRCSGNDSQKCSVLGEWSTFQVCENGCTGEGVCEAAVDSGAPDSSEPVEDSAAPVEDSAPPPPPPVDSGSPVVDSGNEVDSATPPPPPVDSGPPPVCTNGAMQCQGSNVETCVAGQWGSPVACSAPVDAVPSCSGAGVCGWSCESGLTDCSGACVNTATDNNNCGSCGHSCGGDTCSASKCGPTEIVTSTTGSIQSLAIDNNGLYWVASVSAVDNVAMAANTKGATVKPLISGVLASRDIVVDNGFIYWTTNTTTEITLYALPSGGTTIASMNVMQGQSTQAIGAVNGVVVWGFGQTATGTGTYEGYFGQTNATDWTNTMTWASSEAGNDPMTVDFVTTDGTYAYWADDTNNSIDAQNRVSNPIAKASQPKFITLNQGGLVWYNQGTHQLLRANLPAPTTVTPTIIIGAFVTNSRFVYDSNNVIYWSDTTAGPTSAVVKSYDPSSDTTKTLATIPSGFFCNGIAVDDANVYYTISTSSASSIYRIAK